MTRWSSRRWKNINSLIFMAFAFLMGVAGVLAERPRVYALLNAKLVVAPGKEISKGTIVLRDGLIESVGANITVPPDAVEIDVSGMVVYPGLIDILSNLGLRRSAVPPPAAGSRTIVPPVDEERREVPTGAIHPLSRVHPERQVCDLIVPFDGDNKDAARYRNMGITTVLVAPEHGLLRGFSALINLKDNVPTTQLILRDHAAQHVSFEHGQFGQGYPSSLMGAAAAIRQVLLDTDRYVTWKKRYLAHPGGMKRPEFTSAYEALAPVIGRATPLIFETENKQDVLLADRLAREFNLNAVIVGTGTEWELLDQISAIKRPMILPISMPDKPKVEDADEALEVTSRDLRHYVYASENPSRFSKAGIKFALTTYGLKNFADFPRNMLKILDAGLSREAALAAFTTIPAEILGVSNTVGTLEPGKIANLFVADGPLFAQKTKVKLVFVDGTEYKVEEEKKPKGDPTAVVDPRGTWSVVLEFPRGRAVTRSWTIRGSRGNYSGTAETRQGTVEFLSVQLEGNLLTLTLPEYGGNRSSEATVVITGDSFEGSIEQGTLTIPVRGTRASGPNRGAQ